MATASFAQRVEELRDDRRHGGSWMARRAVEALLEVAREDADSCEELHARLVAAGRELAAARPVMGAIAGAIGRVLAAAQREAHLPLDEFRRVLEAEARGLISSRDRAAASIAIQLRPLLSDALVLTHSASVTVRAAVLRARPRRVVCTVSAPFEEGRAFADGLREEGLEVELVPDEDAAAALRDASVFLVGADTVYLDGSLCNKIGTRPLALEAAKQGVPTLVACEVLKLAPHEPPAESEEPENFDITPADLIERIVTEEGSYAPEDVRPLIDRTPFLRAGYALLGGN